MLLPDGEGACAVVPVDGDGGIDSLFVVVVVALVLIKGEMGVGARVNAQLEVVP